MDTEQDTDRRVSCTVTPSALEFIDYYADRRKLYRSNWLREAISEKLEREIEAETAQYFAYEGHA